MPEDEPTSVHGSSRGPSGALKELKVRTTDGNMKVEKA